MSNHISLIFCEKCKTKYHVCIGFGNRSGTLKWKCDNCGHINIKDYPYPFRFPEEEKIKED